MGHVGNLRLLVGLFLNQCRIKHLWDLVSVVQSLFEVPNIVLTATATKEIQRDIYDVLGFHSETMCVVSDLPNRPNIFIDLKECTERYETELEWLLDLLLKCDSRNKIIVYVRSINMCYQLYLWLVTSLIEKCFVGEEAGPSNRRVDMFHANTDKISKERIIDQFVKENSNIEVLISTVAFEMGVNIPNIDIVVHRGLPSSCLSYWQEVGDVLTMAEGAMQSVMHLKEASQAVKMTLLRNLLC